MTRDTAKVIEQDCELTLDDLEAVSGAAAVDYVHTQAFPPNPCGGVYRLNPQPLPPG
jgi:hypothetical protein